MMEWHVLMESQLPGAVHMRRDVALAAEPMPTVRLFTWEPSAISLGWKQPSPDWLGSVRWVAAGLHEVERPTGGGMAFHGSDVSIAVVVPRSAGLSLQQVMCAVCRSAARLCESFGADPSCGMDELSQGRVTYCLTQTSPYAVYLRGRKVAGFALRRFPRTWLIQGSLLVRPLPDRFHRALPEDVIAQLEARAVSLSEVVRQSVSEDDVMRQWHAGWASWWEEAPLGAGAEVAVANAL